MANRSVVLTAADQSDLVAVDLRLALAGRPLLRVDGDPRRLGIEVALLDAPRDVADVVVVSVGRSFARKRVLAAELDMLRIGKPPVHGPPIGIAITLADGPEAFAVSDALADVLG